MGRWYSSRVFVLVCGALIVLLAALGVVQYEWSTRVAAADAQREKEHLNSAASLFADEFNAAASEAVEFLQTDAWRALRSGERLAGVPKLVGELYYLEVPPQGVPKAKRLTADGLFAEASVPAWAAVRRCAPLAIEQPPAIIAPIYSLSSTARSAETSHRNEVRIVTDFAGQPQSCFVARIDQAYVRDALVPQLLRQSFGATTLADYDFAVASRGRPENVFYGVRRPADLQKLFFSITPGPLPFLKESSATSPPPRQSMILVQRVQETVVGSAGANLATLLGPGIWELEVSHKGLPLDGWFERKRRLDLLASLGVESLLVAAIAFLILATRRMQRLADQKIQFVAGVSHELRTPVSAIAMLSRNQADGLISGADRVKQYGELIHQESRRLNEMVEQILEYAGIHSGLRRPAQSEVDLRGLIQDAVEARRKELERAGFAVEVVLSPDLPVVLGDARLLRIAIDNLLSNAQKYAGGGRWIRVNASYSPAEKELRLSVEDRGAGIDPMDQTEIFEPFSRGRAAVEAQIPGSGLGLSLVRSAAEAHSGTVTLESAPGRGSTFTMHLPV